MLTICRKKARLAGLEPELYMQAMESLDLPQRYQTILAPSSSFQLLINPRKAEQAMAAMARHLRRGGALVMPFMVLWQNGDPLLQDWKTSEIYDEANRTLIRRFSQVRHEPELQLEYTETCYELYTGEDMQLQEDFSQSGTEIVRWYTQRQVFRLFRDHGFRQVRLVEGFTYQTAGEDSRLFTAIGLKG
jgi:hypothetical protein